MEKSYPEEDDERVRREKQEKEKADKEREAGNTKKDGKKESKFDEIKREYDPVKLAIKALLEVVESGSKNIEIALIERGKEMEFMDADAIAKIADGILAEREALEKKKNESSASA
jgi:20S proteasome subunit alpha 4